MQNKTVIITGATQGIGLATSQLLAKNGYQVLGIARNIPQQNFPGELFLCDLADSIATAKVLTEIADKYQVTHIINNVGVAIPQSLGQIDFDSLHKVYDLNVRTAVQVTQMFIDKMKQQQYGRIVNIASRAIFGVVDRSSYAAEKSALIGLTRTWALELAQFGITVNAVAPGPIETELFRKARPIGSVAEKQTLMSIPMGRIGKPQEIAAAIAFLLSDAAGFITGQTLCVDGGGSL